MSLLLQIVCEMSEVPLLLWCYSPYLKLAPKMSVLDLSTEKNCNMIAEGIRRVAEAYL